MRMLNVPLISIALLLFLPFVISNIQNITLECKQVCDDDNYCELSCNLPDGLKANSFAEIASLNIKNDEKSSKYETQMETISRGLEINSKFMLENLPQKIGVKIQKLQKFTVTSSILRNIKRADFNAMVNLKELDLSHNKIESIPQDTFHNLTKLEVLSINDNQISYLYVDTLKNLLNLREFDAQYNRIERLEANFFRYNVKLVRIYLNHNDLSSIHEDFLKLLDLSVVDLRGNAEYCRNCGVMAKEASLARFNVCYRDRHDTEKSTKENFETCVNKKISEREYLAKFIDQCSQLKRNETIKMNSTMSDCVPSIKNEHRVSFDTLRKIESCIVGYLRDESILLDNYVSCATDKASKNKDLGDLIKSCSEHRNIGMRKAEQDFASCKFCEQMNNEENVKMCDLRFMLDYGDKIENFQAEVNKFFNKS